MSSSAKGAAAHTALRYGRMSDLTADFIRERIISGVLLPGESIQIDDVAKRLEVSATPVREALQTLRVEGFVDSVRGQGFRVHQIRAEDIEDVFFAHSVIAGELAARTTMKISEQKLRELEALHYELLAAALTNDHENVERSNHEFHRVLNTTVEAPKLQWMVRLFTKYVPRNFYAQIEGWPEATRDDHTEILNAMKARNPEAARRATESHITNSGSLLAAHFRQMTVAAAEAGEA